MANTPEQVPPGEIMQRYCQLAGAEAYCVPTRTACSILYVRTFVCAAIFGILRRITFTVLLFTKSW